jgi:hypothetical protein
MLVLRLSASDHQTLADALRLASSQAAATDRRRFCALLDRLASQAAVGRAVQRRRRATLERGVRCGS